MLIQIVDVIQAGAIQPLSRHVQNTFGAKNGFSVISRPKLDQFDPEFCSLPEDREQVLRSEFQLASRFFSDSLAVPFP